MSVTNANTSEKLLITAETVDQLHSLSDKLMAAGFYPAAAYGPDPKVGSIVPGTATAGRYLKIVLTIGGLFACLIFIIEAYGSVIAYPINASNKPLFAWPVFWVTSIDGGLLLASVLCLALFLYRADLPRWYRGDVPELVTERPDDFHAVVNVPSEEETELREIVAKAAPGASIVRIDPS